MIVESQEWMQSVDRDGITPIARGESSEAGPTSRHGTEGGRATPAAVDRLREGRQRRLNLYERRAVRDLQNAQSKVAADERVGALVERDHALSFLYKKPANYIRTKTPGFQAGLLDAVERGLPEPQS